MKISHIQSTLREKIEDEKDDQDYLKIFTKPTKLTEEEITFYKEKKICLVCKGKLGGFNTFLFLCPNCDALYCEKCARTLSNLENSCWVCDKPIDDSKPVKTYEAEQEEEAFTISEEPSKKPK